MHKLTKKEDIIKKCPFSNTAFDFVSKISNESQKNLTILSLGTILSSGLPNYTSSYCDDSITTHIYSVVVGGSSSGKSNATKLIAVFDGVLSKIRQRNEEKTKGKTIEEIEKITEEILLVGDQFTEASLVKSLKSAEKNGILILCSEFDSLANSNNPKFGAEVSSILRKAYDHEIISKQVSGEGRKNFSQVIKEPKIAILATGTHGQVNPFFSKASENGLLFRFLFFELDSQDEWQSQIENTRPFRKKELEKMCEYVTCVYDFFCEKPMTFVLSRQQKLDFVDFWNLQYKRFSHLYGPRVRDYIQRLQKSCYRFMMTWAAHLGNFSQGEVTAPEELFDFSLLFFEKTILPNSFKFANQFCFAKEAKIKETPSSILDDMGCVFQNKNWLEICEQKGVLVRTAQRWLKALEEQKKVLFNEGRYVKNSPACNLKKAT